jgi:hypothetical protein
MIGLILPAAISGRDLGEGDAQGVSGIDPDEGRGPFLDLLGAFGGKVRQHEGSVLR